MCRLWYFKVISSFSLTFNYVLDDFFRYFDEFLTGKFTSEVFKNQYKVREAADIVHKLHLIAQELPYDRFAAVSIVHCSFYFLVELFLF